jgi:hypothetical protein
MNSRDLLTRTVLTTLLACGVALPSVEGASAQNCQAICNQAYSFARQSRGDLAFIQQFQQLQNACQSCQLQQRVRPQANNPPPAQMPKWNPPVQTEREKAIGKAMEEVMQRTGDWAMRGAVLPKGAPLSGETVKMETVKIPDGYVDPFAARALSTSSSTSVSKPSGNIWNPNQQSHMTPGTAPTVQSPATSSPASKGSYQTCMAGNTFAGDRAYCEMGGYTYFKNGSVLKSQ